MQKLNANETNGIVIGPEFSRIFAEIILQQIDKNLYDKLKLEDLDGKNLIHKVDYEVFRYIDDYFVFYNHENDAERIIKEFKLCLNEYNLYLNESKSILYKKPIITEISLAKQKITDLFSEHLKIKERVIKGPDQNEDTTILYFSSNNVITRFKSIVKETNVEYKDIMNYSLAVLDRKTAKVIKTYKKQQETNDDLIEKEYEKGILEILDVAFFLYSVSPRVNSTIKLCLILDKIVSFLKKNNSNNYNEPFSANNKHNIFKKISDEIYLILQKNRSKSEAQIETLYLIIALNQLGREYRLNPKVLCSYFNIVIHSNGKVEFKTELNYFSITTLLFYIKDIELYSGIREAIKKYIKTKFQNVTSDPNWKRNTEIVLLLMDSLSCPFLNEVISPYDRKQIIYQLDKLKDAALKPIDDLPSYIEELTKIILSLGKTVFFNKLKREAIHKIVNNFNQYKLELQEVYGKDYNLVTGFNVYKYEEAFINAIISLKNDFAQHVNKYKFKKELLSSLDIKKNQIALIEQEKFWFIKWTEFDFKMELQAKRSQEVY